MRDIDTKFVIRYRDVVVGRKLGEGSYGVVYRAGARVATVARGDDVARAAWRNIDVALKEIRVGAIADSRDARRADRHQGSTRSARSICRRWRSSQ